VSRRERGERGSRQQQRSEQESGAPLRRMNPGGSPPSSCCSSLSLAAGAAGCGRRPLLAKPQALAATVMRPAELTAALSPIGRCAAVIRHQHHRLGRCMGYVRVCQVAWNCLRRLLHALFRSSWVAWSALTLATRMAAAPMVNLQGVGQRKGLEVEMRAATTALAVGGLSRGRLAVSCHLFCFALLFFVFQKFLLATTWGPKSGEIPRVKPSVHTSKKSGMNTMQVCLSEQRRSGLEATRNPNLSAIPFFLFVVPWADGWLRRRWWEGSLWSCFRSGIGITLVAGLGCVSILPPERNCVKH